MSNQLWVRGEEIQHVASVLGNGTCLRILNLLSKRSLDVSTLASKLGLTESTVSVDVQELQNLGLLDVTYGKGKRGIRKICRLAKNSIHIKLR